MSGASKGRAVAHVLAHACATSPEQRAHILEQVGTSPDFARHHQVVFDVIQTDAGHVAVVGHDFYPITPGWAYVFQHRYRMGHRYS